MLLLFSVINKSGVGATQVRALGSNLVTMGGQAG